MRVLVIGGAVICAAAYFLFLRRRRRARPELSHADKIKGLKLMDPIYGYRHLVEEDTQLVQPFDFDLAAVRALRQRFVLHAHDVVIATYPKCGTTWMQQLILLLLRGSDGTCAPMRDAPWLEMSASSAANGEMSSSPAISVDDLCSLPPPDLAVDCGRRVWKTHAPEGHPPWRHSSGGGNSASMAGAKVVVVARNAKDAAVSLLHHSSNITPFAWHGGWAEFAPLFLDGRVESNSWWDWHAGWWHACQREPQAVLWVTFEEMSADLPAVAKRVAEHLGLERSWTELEAVARRCSFSSMKVEAECRDHAAEASGGHVKKKHFRKGQVGGWRAVLRHEDVIAFDAKNAELAARCNGLILFEGDTD